MGSAMTLTGGDGGLLSSPRVVDRISSVPLWIDPVLDRLGGPNAVAFILLVLSDNLINMCAELQHGDVLILN